MQRLFILLLMLTFLSCREKEKEIYDLLISNASVLDINTGEVEENRLLLISNDTIRKIEDAGKIEQYEARETLDAEGKFVMPGLWDMHVHFRGGDTLVEENKNFLPLFLAYGITSVRDAGGDITPSVLEWREQVKNKKIIGPRIFTPGPKLDGPDPAWPGSITITNEEDIEAALESLESMGVDFVKMYDGSLTKEAFYAIIRAAEERGLKTTGHMPLSADFLEAIEFGLDGAEHIYYPLKACSPVADSLTSLNMGYGMIGKIIDTYDPQLAEQVFIKIQESEVYITPTLHIQSTLSQILEVDHTKDTILPYIGSKIQETYRGRVEGAKRAQASGSKMRQKMEEISAKMILPMFNEGVKILAGSDSGAFNSYVYPGESLHGELRALVKAGLTPLQAIQTSVVNGPDFFNLGNSYSSVAEGKVADLLLLNKNPLENIENLSDIFAVIKSSEVYEKRELQEMLNSIR